jgi:hypothetical protein
MKTRLDNQYGWLIDISPDERAIVSSVSTVTRQWSGSGGSSAVSRKKHKEKRGHPLLRAEWPLKRAPRAGMPRALKREVNHD